MASLPVLVAQYRNNAIWQYGENISGKYHETMLAGTVMYHGKWRKWRNKAGEIYQ
jgi:hypothetical protein